MAEPAHNSYPRSPNLSSRSYDSSSVSSATSPRPHSHYVTGVLAYSTRHALPRTAHSPHLAGMPPLPSVNHGFPPYSPGRSNIIGPHDPIASADPLAHHNTLLVQPGLGPQSQKRAYRQRRKDPSCDACRERKVKCDATETTSCSECSSRNVKCQFTKETNRRMSSIKQVQDLEKQMDRYKRENLYLRRMLQDHQQPPIHLDAENTTHPQPLHHMPAMEVKPRSKHGKLVLHELATARANLLAVSRGIWKPPSNHPSLTPLSRHCPVPEIPPKPMTDDLVHCYASSIHTMFPIIHLPTFRAAVDDLYRSNPSHAPAAWLSMFFAVLAAASLFAVQNPSAPSATLPVADLIDTSWRLMDPWIDSFTLDDARAYILLVICLDEMNLKSAAWTWLGTAIRVGQHLCLYTDSHDNFALVETEMRSRTWWAMYVLDRTLATELGHPFLINDSDCDVTLPAAVDDHYLHDDGLHVPAGAEPLTHSLLAIIHVIRSYTPIIQAISHPTLSSTNLSLLDSHLAKCLNTFPPQCDPSSTAALAPHFLPPLAYLLHARLVVHRHNLSPNCTHDIRFAAVEACVHISMDTASLLARTSAPAECASSLLATHLFRSTLFLLLAAQFDQAITCIRALAPMEASRDVVAHCGKYLAFFLTVLTSKRAEHASHISRAAPAAPAPPSMMPSSRMHPEHPTTLLVSLARDEELLAYVSADAQASPSRTWVWTTLERDLIEAEHAADSLQPIQRSGLPRAEPRIWGGWAQLEASIRSLSTSSHHHAAVWGSTAPRPPTPPLHEQPTAGVGAAPLTDGVRQHYHHHQNHHHHHHPDQFRTTLEPSYGNRAAPVSLSPEIEVQKRGGSDRLSIANIIRSSI